MSGVENRPGSDISFKCFSLKVYFVNNMTKLFSSLGCLLPCPTKAHPRRRIMRVDLLQEENSGNESRSRRGRVSLYRRCCFAIQKIWVKESRDCNDNREIPCNHNISERDLVEQSQTDRDQAKGLVSVAKTSALEDVLPPSPEDYIAACFHGLKLQLSPPKRRQFKHLLYSCKTLRSQVIQH